MTKRRAIGNYLFRGRHDFRPAILHLVQKAGAARHGAQHGSGKQYRWGDRVISHRTAVRLRLVNVGASSLARDAGSLGYPVCLVCGQSRSPLASQADLQAFEQDHRLRCGKPVEPVGFYADVTSDAISLENCVDREEVYSVMEALRLGAADVLDMEVEDLQLLAIGQPGGRGLSLLLYDVGIADQHLERAGTPGGSVNSLSVVLVPGAVCL